MLTSFTNLESELDNRLSTSSVLNPIDPETGLPKPQFGTLALIIIGAILSWLIQRCLDDLFPHDVKKPGLMKRMLLRIEVNRLVNEYGGKVGMGVLERIKVADELLDHMYQIGEHMTDDEFYQVKNSAIQYVPMQMNG